jgi:hypothetical protein
MMKTACLTALLLLAALFAFGVRGAAQNNFTGKNHQRRDEQATVKPDAAAIRKLIDELKSTDFELREKATQALSRLDEVPDVLREATSTDDAELRRRAQMAIEAIAARVEEKAFRAMVANLQKLELDRFVRRMVVDEKFASDKQWQLVQVIARAIASRVSELGGPQLPSPAFEVTSLPVADVAREQVAFRGKRILVSDPNLPMVGVHECVVLCTGRMPRMTSLTHSIAVIDGDFTRATQIDKSLVIVRGNFGPVTSIRDSIVLATGNMEGGTGCENSFLQVANDQVRFTRALDSVLLKTLIRTTGANNCRTIDVDQGPLQLLRFSSRKPDHELIWGQEVDGLTLALAATDDRDRYLLRWKNVGKEPLQVSWIRLHLDPMDKNRDDLLNHVMLKMPDGKIALPRKYAAPRTDVPYLGGTVVLHPGKIHDETIDLWAYVERPAAEGRYQLSIELEIPKGRRVGESHLRSWVGRIRSNELELTIAK